VSALWLVLVAAGCGGLAVVCLALGIVGLAAGGPGEEDLQGIAVPGDGTFVVDEPGTFTIYYESSSYVEEGVCRRTTTGVDDRPDLRCDEQLLRDAGPAPVVRPEGGDSLQVVDPGASAARFDLDAHLPVWSFEADEAGTYQLSLEDAPLGTEVVAVAPDGDGPASWTVLPFLLFLLFALAAGVLLIVALVRAVRGAGRGSRRAGPPPPPPTTSWSPPTGPAAPMAPSTAPPPSGSSGTERQAF
jgi:hypothetical protein